MKKFILSVAALVFTAASFAQQPIPADPAVRTGKLDNGLTYYVRHHEEPKGQANFYIAQKVGSILEDENQRGLAHFLEHMCFNGTQKFPGNGIIKYCESIGVKFGADLNAYTSIDETVYNIDNVPVEKVPSAVDSCLWILHDWADGLLLTNEDIDKERGVIHEEWRYRMGAAMRLYEKIFPQIYPNNKYGVRLPIGTMEVVDNFPYKALRDYYETWYRPDQQGIIVVGDINVDEVEAKIKDIFGTIATPVNPKERYYVSVEDNKEPIFALDKDKEQTYAVTYIFRKHEKFPKEQKNQLNYLVYKCISALANQMINARIAEIAQAPNPPFIQAGVDDEDFLFATTKGAFQGFAVSSETKLIEASTCVYREMLRAVRGGFTASEFERAKAEMISEIETQYKQREKRKSAEFCREYVRMFIDNEPAPGIEYEYALLQQISPVITVEMVNQYISNLVTEGNLVVCSLLPDKEGVTYPTKEEYAAAFAAVEKEDIPAYVDKVSDEPLILNYPAMGAVVKTKEVEFGYKMFRFENGATVYFKQTDFNADEVRMNAFSQGGTSLYPEKMAKMVSVASEVMKIGGVGNFSVTDLNKVLAGKQISVKPFIELYEEGVKAKSTPKDFETMLQLNYLYFTALRNDYEAWDAWKTRVKASIANREANPMSAFSDSLKKALYNGNPRVASLKLEDVEALNYNEIMQIARQRFANAGDFTFIITGAIDEATVLPLIRQYIGSLPAAGNKENANKKACEFAKGKVSVLYDKPMQVPMVTNGFFYQSKVKYNLKNDLAFNLGLNALSIVLLEEIREKESGTYGIGAYGMMSDSPVPQAYFQIPYQCNPDKYEYLNKRVAEIVADFIANGPSAENLSKGKEYFLKNYKEDTRENYFYANAMKTLIESNVDIVTNYEAVLESITAEDVRAIIAAVVNSGNYCEVIQKGVPKE